MALPLRVSLMDIMNLCIVLGVTLGITSTSGFSMQSSPHGVVHVFFMHREPVYIPRYNTSDTVINNREPPLRRLYHDLMNYLDRSIDSVETLERDYQQPLNHSVDPWVHFINRTKALRDNFLSVDTSNGNDTVDPWVHFINRTKALLDNHTSVDTSNGNDTVDPWVHFINRTKALLDNHTSVDSINGTDTNILTSYNVRSDIETNFIVPGSNKTLKLVKRKRRHSNASNPDVTGSTEQSLVTHNLTRTQETQHIEAGDGFTSTVAKMIAMIDEQLENKTQAILKRIKRVADTIDNEKEDVKIQPEVVNNAETAPSVQGIDEVKTKLVTNTNEESGTQAIPVLGNETAQAISSPIPNTTSQPEPKLNATSSLEAHEININVQDKTSNNTPSITDQNSSVLQNVINEDAKENSVMGQNYSLGTKAPTVTQSKEEEYENDKEQQQLRNIMDAVPNTILPDDNNYGNRVRGEEQYSNGDVMTALVIPVFLVVLMGTLLYAMHNMSQYFITRTHHRQPPNHQQRAPPGDGFVDIPLNNVAVTNPIEVQENKPKTEETVNFVEVAQPAPTEPIKTVSSGHNVNTSFLPQATDRVSKINMVANYVCDLNKQGTPVNESSPNDTKL